MVKKKGYWSQPLFSKPAKSLAKPRSSKEKVEKCGICGKAKCNCAMPEVTANTKKVEVEGKNGRKRTVTVKTGTSTDARGIEWCNTCTMRCHNGVCSNVTCSTRK